MSESWLLESWLSSSSSMGAVIQDWLSSMEAASWLSSVGVVPWLCSSALGGAGAGTPGPETPGPETPGPGFPDPETPGAETLGPSGAAGGSSSWGEGFAGPDVTEASGPRLRALRPLRLHALLSLFGTEAVSTISREAPFASPLGSTSSSVSWQGVHTACACVPCVPCMRCVPCVLCVRACVRILCTW